MWFEDEGRFGQQGTITRVWALKGKRAYVPKQTDYEWVCVFGAICPMTGQSHGCLISFSDTMAMNGYLRDFIKHIVAGSCLKFIFGRCMGRQRLKIKTQCNKYRENGYKVEEEVPIGNGRAVDLVASKDGKRIAIEVETGKSYAEGNIKKCEEARFDKVVTIKTEK